MENWLDETLENLPHQKRFYRFLCFITGKRKKKFTYKEWYVILRALNGNTESDDNDKGKSFALEQIVKLYKFNNNRYPENIEINDGQ